LTWVLAAGQVELVWLEQNGPPVSLPTRVGFGSRLFNSALPRRSGEVAVQFDPEGVRCVIRLERSATSAGGPAAAGP
jgi:two-component sensor histidine kinase